MKANDLFKSWDEYKERNKQNLLDIADDDSFFPDDMKVDQLTTKKGKPELKRTMIVF